eukprot:2641903-Prymnesium_polylepis.2
MYHYWKCYSNIGNSKVVTIFTKDVDYYTWGECTTDAITGYMYCGDHCSRCMNGDFRAGAGSAVVTRLTNNLARDNAFHNPWLWNPAS